MAVRKDDSKHECSCGRSFRHAISLRRHQNVTGCAAKVETQESQPSKAACESIDLAPIAAPTAGPTPPTSESAPGQPAPKVERSPITVEQMAEWQRRWENQPVSLQQSLNELGKETKENLKTCALGACQAASGLRWLATVGARFAVFVALVAVLGWSVLFGLSRHLEAAPAPVSQQVAMELTARTMVEDLLTLGRVGQFQKAHTLLTPSTRERIDSVRLAAVLNGLPLHQSPSSYRVQTVNAQTIEVTVLRANALEVYTVSRHQAGWGLSGISVREV